MFAVVDNFSSFMDKGGDVLFLLFVVTLLLWFFILEKLYFFKKVMPKLIIQKTKEWEQQVDKSSWWALRVRESFIADIKVELFKRVGMIKTLVVLCPLLGLLGTVVGMMVVFGVMATSGTGNARMMAGGISMATIPTMAGMVVALSGIYLGSFIEKKAENEYDQLGAKFPVEA